MQCFFVDSIVVDSVVSRGPFSGNLRKTEISKFYEKTIKIAGKTRLWEVWHVIL